MCCDIKRFKNITFVSLGEQVTVAAHQIVREFSVIHLERCCLDWLDFVVLVMAVELQLQLVFVVVVYLMMVVMVLFYLDWIYSICSDSHPSHKLNLVAKVAVDLLALECTKNKDDKESLNFDKF